MCKTNNFAKISKNLSEHKSKNITTLLGDQNNYVKNLNIISNAAKSFNSLIA